MGIDGSGKDRHTAHIALLQALDPGAPVQTGADWCDIRNSYPVGQSFRGSYTIFKYGADLTFSVNADGTGRIVKLVVLGSDRTADALANGGGSVTLTPNSEHAYDCKQSDYYLAWQMSGQFVEWATSLVEQHVKIRPTDLLLYARYYGHDDPKKWFYFKVLGVWHYAELAPV